MNSQLEKPCIMFRFNSYYFLFKGLAVCFISLQMSEGNGKWKCHKTLGAFIYCRLIRESKGRKDHDSRPWGTSV